MKLWPLAAAVCALSLPAHAQSTSSCSWVGNVWTCNHTAPPPPLNPAPPIQWDTLRQPNNTFSDSFERGRAIGERMRQSRLEREKIEAETELLRAQRRAIEQNAGQGGVPVSLAPDYLAKFTAAAASRKHLFPDFDAVVSQPDLPITVDMVILMTSSPYAADIAYYQATHRAEAAAISRLSLLEAGRAIDRIDRELQEADKANAGE